MPSVDPDALRTEAKRWSDLAQEMTEIRQATAGLWLGMFAFFPGGLGTEAGHYLKYKDCLDQVVSRLQGGAIEFELIGITLGNIASSYEEGERVTADDFRVTENEVQRATDGHTPRPPAGGGREQEYT